MLSSRCSHCWLNVWWCYWLSLIYIHHLTYSTIFQVFSSSRRDSGGGIYRAGSSSLSLLPYFDMADLASSGPYIVSKHYLIFGKKLQKKQLIYKRKRCQCNWANRQISWGMDNHLVILQQHKMYQRGESLKDFFEHLNGCCYVIFLVVFLETFGVAIFQGAKAIASVQRSPRPPECPWCISGAGHPACVFGALPHSPLMCPWCTGADIIFTLAWCSTRIPWYALDAMCNALCWAYQGGMQ